jgi:hypothetical protein
MTTIHMSIIHIIYSTPLILLQIFMMVIYLARACLTKKLVYQHTCNLHVVAYFEPAVNRGDPYFLRSSSSGQIQPAISGLQINQHRMEAIAPSSNSRTPPNNHNELDP